MPRRSNADLERENEALWERNRQLQARINQLLWDEEELDDDSESDDSDEEEEDEIN